MTSIRPERHKAIIDRQTYRSDTLNGGAKGPMYG
jgi:hypothetical protein